MLTDKSTESTTKPTSLPKINDSLPKVQVGTIVLHKMFGEGKIKKLHSDKIIVVFKQGEKQFTYPNAFVDGYLQKIK